MDNDKPEKLQKGRISPNRKEAKSPEMKQNSSPGNLKSRAQLKKNEARGDGDDSDQTEKAGRGADEPESPTKNSKGAPSGGATATKPPRKKKRGPEATGALS